MSLEESAPSYDDVPTQSAPALPCSTSSPSQPLTMSLPSPPLRWSSPSEPLTLSAPGPPHRKSGALPPVKSSSPLMLSLPPSPTITSETSALPARKSSPAVPTIVAACPKHVGTVAEPAGLDPATGNATAANAPTIPVNLRTTAPSPIERDKRKPDRPAGLRRLRGPERKTLGRQAQLLALGLVVVGPAVCRPLAVQH